MGALVPAPNDFVGPVVTPVPGHFVLGAERQAGRW